MVPGYPGIQPMVRGTNTAIAGGMLEVTRALTLSICTLWRKAGRGFVFGAKGVEIPIPSLYVDVTFSPNTTNQRAET